MEVNAKMRLEIVINTEVQKHFPWRWEDAFCFLE